MKFFSWKKSEKRWSERAWRWFVWVGTTVLFGVFFLLHSFGALGMFFPYVGELTGGLMGERHYLLLFQNNTELRPGGGFISAYGLVHFKGGMFRGLEMHDVYGEIDEHEYVEPPYPLGKLLKGKFYQGHTFRDANFSPDFPTSAEDVLSFFRMVYPEQQVDGVIAVNFSLLEDLMGVYGPMRIGDREVSKDGLFEMLEHSVTDIDKHSVEDLANRKNVLKPLARNLMKKMVLSPLTWRDMTGVVKDNLDRRGLQFYFKNEGLQKMVAEHGWAGEFPEKAEQDFIGLVEANLGGMKSDRYLKRDVDYRVFIDENAQSGELKARAELRIDLFHAGEWNVPLSGGYRGYFRTYVPKGVVVKEKPLASDVYDDGEFKVLGLKVSLEPGKSTELKYVYELPGDVVKDKEYGLDLWKQSGREGDRYRVVVKGPLGSPFGSEEFEVTENIAEFDEVLVTDKALKLQVLPDVLPPRVVHQALYDHGTVELFFNEVVSGSSVSDPLNYKVVDLNVKHPDKTDEIVVTGVEHRDKEVKIRVSGVTDQDREHYQLRVGGVIKDTKGNVFAKEPRTFTLVQRFIQRDED